MILFPALDIMNGEVVRLIQGDFAQKTVFAKDPAELLAQFVRAGVEHVHLVDLSGAKDPAQRQTELFSRLIADLPLKIQIGGGIRKLQEIEELLHAGAERVVLGSVAVTNPDLVRQAIANFGVEHLTLALDVRLTNNIPMVMTHGWTEASGLSFAEALAPFAPLRLKRVLCTDIAVDGRPVGPNVALYRSLREQFPELEIQASGGVTTLADLQALNRVGVHSVVVGRALLSGAFSIAEALAHAQ